MLVDGEEAGGDVRARPGCRPEEGIGHVAIVGRAANEKGVAGLGREKVVEDSGLNEVRLEDS